MFSVGHKSSGGIKHLNCEIHSYQNELLQLKYPTILDFYLISTILLSNRIAHFFIMLFHEL